MQKIKIVSVFLILIVTNTIFSQKKISLSPEFHKNRRATFRKQMPENSVAILFPNPIRNRSNDVDYVYHQDPNFYYLSGLKETDAVLVIFSEPQKNSTSKSYNETLYVRKKNAKNTLWNGDLLGVKGTTEKLKINSKSTREFVSKPIEFKKFSKIFISNIKNTETKNYSKPLSLFNLIEHFKKEVNYDQTINDLQRNVYSSLKKIELQKTDKILESIDSAIKIYPELRKDSILNAFKSSKRMIDYAKVMKQLNNKLHKKTKIDYHTSQVLLSKMREVKTKEELKLLKRAIDISVIGQIEMMKAMQPHISEREIQGVHEFVYKKYGAAYEGYPSIVGAGKNGCVLHYIKNDKPHTEDGELVLMDLGAEFEGYTADVTRTIPTNGKFSKEQKAIYNIVLEAQTAGIKKSIVGNSFWAPGQIAKQIINSGLAKLGVIKSLNEKHNYFPHGTSHYLGLDVHDPGTYGTLKHNSIITVEPGIYIPEGSNCDKKWWGIAIRIEDDILITNDGPVNLSGKAPRFVKEIEKMMKKKSVLKKFKLPKLD